MCYGVLLDPEEDTMTNLKFATYFLIINLNGVSRNPAWIDQINDSNNLFDDIDSAVAFVDFQPLPFPVDYDFKANLIKIDDYTYINSYVGCMVIYRAHNREKNEQYISKK
jgi:hypothetical protein